MTTAIDSQRLTARERMELLCDSFPSLRGRDGTAPWDQHQFAHAMSGGQSSAEKQAAAFVLSVWNGAAARNTWWNAKPFRVGLFDCVVAMQLWDGAHQLAFLRWCQHPFCP